MVHCHSACCYTAYRFKHGGKAFLFTIHTAGQHRTAGNKYCRNVQSGSSHQKSRYILITVGNHNKTVKTMGNSHTFCGICDQISCYKRVFHSNVSHGNTIAYSNCREHNRRTAGHSYTKLYSLCDFIQIHMSGNNFIVGTNNTDQRAFTLFLCITKCVKQTSVRSLLCAGFYGITSHNVLSPSYHGITQVNITDLHLFYYKNMTIQLIYFCIIDVFLY